MGVNYSSFLALGFAVNRSLRQQNPEFQCCIFIFPQFHFSFVHPVGWWQHNSSGASSSLSSRYVLMFQSPSKTLDMWWWGERDTTRTLYKLRKGASPGKMAIFSSIPPPSLPRAVSSSAGPRWGWGKWAGALFKPRWPGQRPAGSRGLATLGEWGQLSRCCALDLSCCQGSKTVIGGGSLRESRAEIPKP